MTPSWIILRTSGQKTLRLAERLQAMGFDAWTPIETQRVRRSRSNLRCVIRLAMLPSFVFAREDHRHALAEMALDPFAGFSIMRQGGRFAAVDDRQLVGLRTIEARRTPPTRAEKALLAGSSVKVKGGPAQGMKGIVERSNRGQTLVCFNGRYLVKIPTSLLACDDAYGFQSETDAAALKAA